MSLENDVRRLAATRPFNLLPREAVQLLAFSCDRTALKAGQSLFAFGDAADAAFFVLSGEIVLSTRGEERRAATGALIGETALATDVARGADARAATESVVMRVPRETFRRVLTEFPEAAVKIHAAAAGRAREMMRRLDEIRVRAFEG